MEYKMTRKRALSIIFFVLMEILTFTALFFKLYSFRKEGVNGFEIISTTVSGLGKFGQWLSIYSVIMLAIIVIELSVYGVSIAIKPEMESIVEAISIVVNVILMFVYMANGNVVKGLLYSVNTTIITTVSYIPFIVGLIIAFSYFAIQVLSEKNRDIRKRMLEVLLFSLTALFTLSSLIFLICKATVRMEYYNIFIYESGLLVFKDNTIALGDLETWLRLYGLIMVVLILAEMITYGVLWFKKSNKIHPIEDIFVLANFLLAFVYMLNGMKAIDTIKENPQTITMGPTTYAYIPFIIVTILMFLYFYIRFFMSKSKKESDKVNISTQN